ncbi:hypothetical protein LSS_19398 [Leptospira santarosai serovar Shermani str. LT 821]|uniref:Uncharacterized protein n=1 Tax=Leptospira santarosai serovar Shermani str. LT 821 TaxID=758847 RepID=K8XTW8_9LEPT|nr:hypothetical protein LSS_19398 [Leptospira santarosai serovar Shermani str. LT 821]
MVNYQLMIGKSKNVCLWFYKHTGVLNTMSPDLVRLELSKEMNLNIKDFQPGFINENESIWMYGSTHEKS